MSRAFEMRSLPASAACSARSTTASSSCASNCVRRLRVVDGARDPWPSVPNGWTDTLGPECTEGSGSSRKRRLHDAALLKLLENLAQGRGPLEAHVSRQFGLDPGLPLDERRHDGGDALRRGPLPHSPHGNRIRRVIPRAGCAPARDRYATSPARWAPVHGGFPIPGGRWAFARDRHAISRAGWADAPDRCAIPGDRWAAARDRYAFSRAGWAAVHGGYAILGDRWAPARDRYAIGRSRYAIPRVR
jgi:hypothetical protein